MDLRSAEQPYVGRADDLDGIARFHTVQVRTDLLGMDERDDGFAGMVGARRMKTTGNMSGLHRDEWRFTADARDDGLTRFLDTLNLPAHCVSDHVH